MATTFGERTRTRLRDEVLDAAARSVADGGWAKLRMQAVATEVGVSRGTLYNEFGTKAQLAQALVLRSIERLSALVGEAVAASDDLAGGWRGAVLAVLRGAERDPVLSAALGGTAGPEFLPLLTSEGHDIVTSSADDMTTAVLARWPELEPRSVAIATDATVRLSISSFLRAGAGQDDTAARIAELATVYLTASAAPPDRPPR